MSYSFKSDDAYRRQPNAFTTYELDGWENERRAYTSEDGNYAISFEGTRWSIQSYSKR